MASDTNPTEDAVLDTDHAELRVYELGFHLDPELPETEVKKSYQALRDLIASKGTVIAEGEPTKIPLAYTISRTETGVGRRDFDTAFFCWIAYEADGASHQEVVSAASAEKRIVRFIDLRTTKEEAKHSEEMQAVYAQMAENGGESAPEEEAAVSDTELDAALKEVA
ncbi:MAG TPA: 30S ribosomal protein S6 [Candidatus Paceibacterota bacterium]|jgi:ribosomal protein S6|nr:30S ribosomal protein S6 [Candidatus Paceibacterota bacterium]